MHLLKLCLVSVSLLLFAATGTFAQLAQDDADLIDDLPKKRKEAAREIPQPARKTKSDPRQPLPPRPSVDLIDDVSPEQKEAAERNAARKNENAIPDNLADALARALRNSPTILVADAKVRQAQAELNEVRLSVVQELTLAFQRRASNKADLALQEATRTEAVEKGYAKDTSTEAMTKLRQAILEDETRILYLLGVGADRAAEAHGALPAGGSMMPPGMGMMPSTPMPGMAPMGGMSGGMAGPMMGPGGMMGMAPMGGMSDGMAAPMMGAGGMMGMAPGRTAKGQGKKRQADLPEHVRAFLDKRLDVDFNEVPLDDVLAYLKEVGGGDIAFVIESPQAWESGSEGHSVTLSLKQVSVRAVLQALVDLHRCAFVFRDYGILVLGPDVDGTEPFESFKAAGTPMVAPPSAVHFGGVGGGGMIGTPPSAPPTAAEKPSDE